MALIRPNAVFDFARSGVFPLAGSFQRSSGAVRIGASGSLIAAAANQPRIDRDAATGAVKGLLLEKQIVNYCPQSNMYTSWYNEGGLTVTQNYTTAPNGTVSATRLQGGSNQGTNNWYYNPVVVPTDTALVVTWSFWAKSNTGSNYTVKNTVYSFGGGTYEHTTWITVTPQWQRFSCVYTVNSNGSLNCQARSLQVGGDISVWGAQLEVSGSPTSLVTTSGASATRAADLASIALSAVPAWNPAEGTLVLRVADALAASANTALLQINDGTTGNRLFWDIDGATGAMAFRQAISSSITTHHTAGSVASGVPFKVASSWKAGSQATSVNGAAAVTSTTAAIPSGLSNLIFGDDGSGAALSRLTICGVMLFPRALSGADLQSLSA